MIDYDDIQYHFQEFLFWLGSIIIRLSTFMIGIASFFVSVSDHLHTFGVWIAWGKSDFE